jgi:hypothetical protein
MVHLPMILRCWQVYRCRFDHSPGERFDHDKIIFSEITLILYFHLFYKTYR